MADDASFGIEVLPEFARFRAELAQMPGWTEDAARKASANMQRQYYNKLAQQAAGLDKVNKTSAGNSAKAWGDVGKKIAELAGGPFSRLGQVVFDLAPKSTAATGALSAGLGAAAGTAIAAAAAVAGVVTVAKRLADGALEARDNLIKAGRAAEIPPESLASLKNYESNTRALSSTVDELQVTIGSFVADDLATLSYTLGQIAESFNSVAGAGRGFRSTLLDIAEASPLGFLAGWARDYQEAQDEAAKSAGRQEEAERRLRAEQERRIDVIQRQVEAEDEAKRAQVRLAEQALERIREANKRAAEEQARLRQQEHDEDLRAMEAAEAEEVRLEREYTAKREEAVKAYYETNRRLEVELFNKEFELRQRALEADRARQAENRRAALTTASATISIGESILDAEMDRLSKGTRAQKEQARRLANWQKGLALYDVAINTAAAVMMAYRIFGPPPSPPGIASAIAAGAQGVAQGAAIAARPLPSFFGGVGRMPGGRGEPAPAMMHGGEKAVTSHAVDTWGEDFIDAINAGLRPLEAVGSGGGGDLIVDGQKMGRWVRREMRRGTAVGTSSPYGRR